MAAPTPPPPPACAQHYRDAYEASKQVLEDTISCPTGHLLDEDHAAIADFEGWTSALALSPAQPLVKSATREYAFSLELLFRGNYRHSFASLRLFLEHSIAAVRFSANEQELRLWLVGDRDIKWGILTDEKTGIFSKEFYAAFFPELESDRREYGAIAEKVYRECSEFVHGNFKAISTLPDGPTFSEPVLAAWRSRAASCRLIAHFALCSRFLPFMSPEEKEAIRAGVTKELGHMPQISARFT